MRLRKRIKKTVEQKPLGTQIEKTATSALPSATVDGIDQDIISHVNHFFATPLPTMEKFSLLTPLDARAALATIERTQLLLEERIRTVRILKALCDNAKKEDSLE